MAPFRTGEHIGETLLLGKGMDSRKNLDNFLEDPFESRKVKKLEGQLGSFFESNVNNSRAQFHNSKDLPFAFFVIKLRSFEKEGM